MAGERRSASLPGRAERFTLLYDGQVLVAINISKTVVGSKDHPSLYWTFFEDVKTVVMPIATVNRQASMT